MSHPQPKQHPGADQFCSEGFNCDTILPMNLGNPVVEEILYQGLTDWIGLTTVVALVEQEKESWWPKESSPPPDSVKAETLNVIRYLLEEDLVRVGELSNSSHHEADFLDWPGTAEAVLGRIATDWEQLTSLDKFEPCWLRTTGKGREYGRLLDP